MQIYQHGLVILLMCICTSMQACDICGGTLSGGMLGLSQWQMQHGFGMNFQSARYKSFHHDQLAHSEEHFRTIAMQGRLQINKRLRISFDLPYSTKLTTLQGQTQTLQGLGDLSCLVLFSPELKKQIGKSKWQRSSLLGVGVQAASGAFNHVDAQKHTINPYLQPGTGAHQLLMQALCLVQTTRYGVSFDVTSKITRANTNGFQFGNQAIANLRWFHLFQVSKMNMLAPSILLSYDKKGADSEQGVRLSGSSQTTLSGGMGCEFVGKRFVLNVQSNLPLKKLSAQQNLVAQPRLSAGVIMFINKRQPKPTHPFKNALPSSSSQLNKF